MYLAATTVPIPSDTFWASAAVSSVQCAAPTSPVVWHDAQLACSAGMTTVLNDGLSPLRGAPGGAAIWLGTVNFDGSIAVSFIVSVTSSLVLTSPAMLIGPMPKVDIFTLVVAVAVSLPLFTVASTSQVTGAGVFFTVSWPSSWKCTGRPGVSVAGMPESFDTVRYASG